MNSLEYLEEFFDRVKHLTDEEIAVLQELFDVHCRSEECCDSNFEFIPPSND